MTTNYRASSVVNITLGNGSVGLASSSGMTLGRGSAAISNETDKDDFIVPFLRTRTGGVAPTAGTSIELWAFTQRADNTWPEIFTVPYVGLDGDLSAVSRDILQAGAVLIGSAIIDANPNRDYVIRGRELAQVFGAVPQNFAFFVVHNTGQALNVTASNHSLTLNSGNYT